MTDLLAIKKEMKSRRPDFVQQDAHKKKRLAKVWRKPRGLQSKMRLHWRGYRRSVEVGYGTPVAVRYQTRSGLIPIVVATVKQLATIDPKTQGIVVGSSVGAKKRLAILQEAVTKKLTVLQQGKADDRIKSLEETFAERKKQKAERVKVKEARRKSIEEKVKKSQKEHKKETVEKEDKSKVEIKKEQDKILSQKGAEY